MSEYTESFLSQILCGLRKAHSTQHALFKLLQSWQNEPDNGSLVRTVLIYLYKAFNCMSLELVIAKLPYHGIYKQSLQLLLDSLTNQKQKTKLGSSFRSWWGINIVVP